MALDHRGGTTTQSGAAVCTGCGSSVGEVNDRRCGHCGSARPHHTYSATVEDGALVLRAIGNLDDDPLLDRWELKNYRETATPKLGAHARQLTSDAINIDYSQPSRPAGVVVPKHSDGTNL